MPFLMFAINRGNGRGFSPESWKQPINTYVAGWTVNQEKNILVISSYKPSESNGHGHATQLHSLATTRVYTLSQLPVECQPYA